MAMDQANGISYSVSIVAITTTTRPILPRMVDRWLEIIQGKELNENLWRSDADNYATTYLGIAAQKGVAVPVWNAIQTME